jgi:NADH-ubiquinone oxidoreductase chain 5
MIINRIGDFGFFLGILSTFFVFKTLDFYNVFLLVPYLKYQNFLFLGIEGNSLNIIAFLFFIGSVGKSAQIGLHTWLPDAMEGPTPVSALIHAATMVTAGVFLIIRCSILFEYAPFVLMVCVFSGSLTAFFAATTGILQNDIKKVIAYSTCSQLGYMVFVCGLSNYTVSFFHLFNHAFFKALLFLAAGSLIHSLSNEQDLRNMGGLLGLLPYTYIVIVIGSLALMGFPFLAGFYSKDIILEVALVSYTVAGKFAYILGTISAFFTSFYSFRVLFLVFIKPNNSFKFFLKSLHELDKTTAFVLTILAFGSIFSGYLFKDLFIGLGSDFFNFSIYIKANNVIIIDSEFIPYYLKLVPTIFSFIGAMISGIIYYAFYKNIVY